LSNRPRPWGCSLGQSYGGVCQVAYLSAVEHPPKVMLFTGGIPPMEFELKEYYNLLWARAEARNLLYYEMYPGDIAAVKLIVRKLLEQPAELPSGGQLSAQRFLSLGSSLGGSPSAFASLHKLISSAFVGGSFAAANTSDITDLVFTRAFLKQVDSRQSFDENPLNFWLRESVHTPTDYDDSRTNWAAENVLYDNWLNEVAFDFQRKCKVESDDQQTLFYGDHVFGWMLDDFAELSGNGLELLTAALAEKDDWDWLYDSSHVMMVLQDGRTRAAAAVYHEDMYVEFKYTSEVAERSFGPLGKCKLFVTNEYQNSGLRDDGATLFSKLHGMASGGIRIPS
jgi:hypothetical protein